MAGIDIDPTPFGEHQIKARMIRNADILACPYLIMVPSHYRDDGSCRCDDPTHIEMAGWGYVWVLGANRTGRWSG